MEVFPADVCHETAGDSVAGICREYANGNIAESARLQDILTGVRTDLYAFGYAPAMVKRALYLMDNSVGASSQPVLTPTAGLDAKIKAVLEKHTLA